MVFVRKVRTKSGATAVQVARYVQGRQEIVKHIGSAHTDTELGVLLEQARSFIGDDQPTLDLEVAPLLPVEGVLPKGQAALINTPSESRTVDAPGRTESTSSTVLREVLEAAYSQLGFDAVGDDVFRDLVMARIVEPPQNSTPAVSSRISDPARRATPRSSGTWR